MMFHGERSTAGKNAEAQRDRGAENGTTSNVQRSTSNVEVGSPRGAKISRHSEREQALANGGECAGESQRGQRAHSPLKAEQLHILQHSLGLDQFGQGNPYRNHYAVTPGADVWPHLMELVKRGLMEDQGAQRLWSGMHCFTVTEKGREVMYAESPEPPKVSRGKRRYEAFLRADNGMKFGEWLKTKWAKEVR